MTLLTASVALVEPCIKSLAPYYLPEAKSIPRLTLALALAKALT